MEKLKSMLYRLYHLRLKTVLPTWFYVRPMTKFMRLMKRDTFIGVEVGVSRGFNSLSMLRYLPVSKLYLVDTGFVNPIKKLMDYNIRLIEKPSVEASKVFPDEYLDFVYIDASHEQKDVEDDIRVWYPKVKPGGIVGGHDFDKVGVHDAVLGFVKDNSYFSSKRDWWFVK